MSGTPIGAAKAAKKIVEKHGADFYKVTGAKGGSVSSDAKKAAAVLREKRKREERGSSE